MWLPRTPRAYERDCTTQSVQSVPGRGWIRADIGWLAATDSQARTERQLPQGPAEREVTCRFGPSLVLLKTRKLRKNRGARKHNTCQTALNWALSGTRNFLVIKRNSGRN